MKPEGLRYIDEYRDSALVLHLSNQIRKVSKKPVNLMEVCGGHTMAIHKNGLTGFLPETINLLSGPGCPVCVSSQTFIDHAIALGNLPDMILTTYGDLLRVPGSLSSLEKEKAAGSDIRIVYSVLDALEIAKQNRKKQVVFIGIGFETTAPASAAAIKKAEMDGIRNFYLLSSHKVMPPALEALAAGDTKIDGFIAPGHVSAITGYGIYQKFAKVYKRGVVISGFEPADILQSILMLVKQIELSNYHVENEYKRIVKPGGNPKALAIMEEVFIPVDAEWRGLGIVPESGLAITEKFAAYDATRKFDVKIPESKPPRGCICGEILTGKSKPSDCRLFASVCNPLNPVGACMVSSEGACSVFYKYRA